MELEVAAVHDGQHKAQRVLGLVGVREADLQAGEARLWWEAAAREQSRCKSKVGGGMGGERASPWRGRCQLESVWVDTIRGVCPLERRECIQTEAGGNCPG